jgi:hypothetical protein
MLNLNQSGAQDLKDEEFLIENDPTWKQMKTLTSTTDESDSLQFKWNSSCLEENYMKSMNMQRVIPQVKHMLFLHIS